MIPRRIYYVWLSGEEMPELQKRCVESWKKYAPDYEICELNTGNSYAGCEDLPKWVVNAYNDGKYAFVSDYLRVKAIYEGGGWYMDTDVELKRPFFDNYENEEFVAGLRLSKNGGVWHGFNFNVSIQAACFGGAAGNRVCGKTYEYYRSPEFSDYYVRPRMRYCNYLHVPLAPQVMSKAAEESGFTYERREYALPDLRIVPDLCAGCKTAESLQSPSVHYHVGAWGELTRDQQYKMATNMNGFDWSALEFKPFGE